MSYRSAFFLFALLVLPVLFFLFLRIFGENRFQEIPVFYAQGPPPELGCQEDQSLTFELTDQLGRTIDQAILKNKISVVNFFYLSCSNDCQKSMDQQARVYNHFLDHSLIQFLSISLGQNDTLESIAQYAANFRADPTQWVFLTGEDSSILDLARCGLVLDSGSDGFSLGENDFVVMDGRNRIRGYYDPLEDQEVDRLIAELQILALDYNR